MSRLLDIIDVVEPLDSQPYTRADAASSQQASQVTVDRTSAETSPTLDDTKGKTSITRRKSSRVPKPGGPSTPTRLSSIRRRNSAVVDAMDFSSGFQAGGSNQASNAGSPQQSSSRGSEPPVEVPIKYTPVTGRISRAKKGVPVHTCDRCRPAKKFTRAEHLRRHQLSHDKPAYPCTYRDCERAFHRPDLLNRHQLRHETQGEGPYRKAATSKSRPSASPAPDRRTPPLKVETPSQTQTQGEDGGPPAASPTDSDDSVTPRTTAGTGESVSAFSSTMGPYTGMPYSPGPSHKRSASEAQLSGPETYTTMSPTTRGTANYDSMAGYPASSGPDVSHQGTYGRAQQNFDSLYEGTNSANYANYNTPIRPILQIPEDPYIPGLSYTQENSPWCSSASDSTYSTQSEGSRTGRMWGSRARSASVNTPDWTSNISQFTSHGIVGPSPFDSMIEQFSEAPFVAPGMTPPTRQTLDIPHAFGGFQYVEAPVGPPALSTYNKPVAQFLSAPRVSDGGAVPRQKLDSSHQFGQLNLSPAMTLSYPQQIPQLGSYLETYWQSFHQMYPVVHRGTFDSTADNLLTSAMAAIGTQYYDTVDARKRGMELNEYCKKSIDHCANWSLSTMQAILLTEIFARFRGRKTKVTLSRHYEELFNRLEQTATQAQLDIPYTAHGIGNNTTAQSLLDRFSSMPSTQQQLSQQPDLHSQWLIWVESESRQRLLSFCFAFDICQSMYHEQSRSKPHFDISRICLPCPDKLWNASSPDEWQVQKNDYSVQHINIIEQDNSFQHAANISRSFFTESLLICHLATRLPERDDRYPNDFVPQNPHPGIANLATIYPNSPLMHIYLALHHTPLHDLLAIAGDTWVFARKVTPPSAFQSAQSRLLTWSRSLAAASATHHACHYLFMVFSEPAPGLVSQFNQPYTSTPFCLGDYWAMYVSALICWAFGHRHSSSGTMSRSSPSTAINTSDMDMDSPETPIDEGRLKAFTYLNGMMELTTDEFITPKASMRGDTSGVIDLVKARLEPDGVGATCMTIDDAIRVLTRIKDSGRARFF